MRRRITLLALVASTVAIAACSDTTSPRPITPKSAHFDDDTNPTCITGSGYWTSDGKWVCG